ncbi:TIGR04438 family Trp-rich protein [Herminiimonas sp. CN]|uniref:TIGR04438 family Trp-rich protein n=1 Tax=Herminiimonas sp. CN TaxID=1349818 RepID=UPI0004743489|nr:TIGR04438 family Trp-rich protein [Herminiimonas sp. CN]
MPLIIAIVLLSTLKYLEVGFFAGLSWWWVAGLMAIAFVWFEFIEKMLGLDKRRAHDSMEKIRKDRVDATFGKNHRNKRR